MVDDTEIPSERVRARLSAKALKAKRLERLEDYLDLLISGYSCERIAQAMKVSVSTVRRAIDRASTIARSWRPTAMRACRFIA